MDWEPLWRHLRQPRRASKPCPDSKRLETPITMKLQPAYPPFFWVGSWGYYRSARHGAKLYVRARHFSPECGRWISVDPIWPKEQPYRYCYQNPISGIDPLGLCSNPATCCCCPKPLNISNLKYYKRQKDRYGHSDDFTGIFYKIDTEDHPVIHGSPPPWAGSQCTFTWEEKCNIKCSGFPPGTNYHTAMDDAGFEKLCGPRRQCRYHYCNIPDQAGLEDTFHWIAQTQMRNHSLNIKMCMRWTFTSSCKAITDCDPLEQQLTYSLHITIDNPYIDPNRSIHISFTKVPAGTECTDTPGAWQ
jgi:RHS repeat-associated protein